MGTQDSVWAGNSDRDFELLSGWRAKAEWEDWRGGFFHYAYDLINDEFLWVSDGTLEVTGYSADDFIRFGMAGYVDRIPLQDRERVDREFESHGGGADVLCRLGYSFRCCDGRVVKLLEFRSLACDEDRNRQVIAGTVFLCD